MIPLLPHDAACKDLLTPGSAGEDRHDEAAKTGTHTNPQPPAE